MNRIFTGNYLEYNVIRDNYRGERNGFSAVASCVVIKGTYPHKLKAYKKMLRKQFKFNPNYTLYNKFTSSSEEEVALLRVLLLQSFEQAILNGEV